MIVRSIFLTTVALTAALAGAPASALTQTNTKPVPPKTPAQKPAPPAPKPATGAKPAAPNPALRTPSKLKERAPATYTVHFDTTAGPFVVEVHRAWAPKGADRFYNLVKYGFYDNARFFRVIPNFMAQFGIHGDPKIQSAWREANITDDPVGVQSNKRGFITFATAGPNTRTTQVFINFRDNVNLDPDFAPFGQVISGMESVDKINAEYRERPVQGRIQVEGNTYLSKEFPKLDFIRKATLGKKPPPPPPAKK